MSKANSPDDEITVTGFLGRERGPTYHDLLPPMRLPRGRGSRVECLRFLAALAYFMADLDEFWRQVLCWEHDRLQRLLGFPVIPEWQERALSGAAMQEAIRWTMDKEFDYAQSLPRSSASVYRRARDRISREHRQRHEACNAVWWPIFAYLLNNKWIYDYLPVPPRPFAPRQLTSGRSPRSAAGTGAVVTPARAPRQVGGAA